jgi:hypothetical protein
MVVGGFLKGCTGRSCSLGWYQARCIIKREEMFLYQDSRSTNSQTVGVPVKIPVTKC